MLIIEILFIIMLSVITQNDIYAECCYAECQGATLWQFHKIIFFGAWHAACSNLHWDHAASSIGGLLHFQVFAVH
jgi:hypothetical protein